MAAGVNVGAGDALPAQLGDGGAEEAPDGEAAPEGADDALREPGAEPLPVGARLLLPDADAVDDADAHVALPVPLAVAHAVGMLALGSGDALAVAQALGAPAVGVAA